MYNYNGDTMKVGILGSGAYGLALSHILLKNKVDVVVWTPSEEECNFLKGKYFYYDDIYMENKYNDLDEDSDIKLLLNSSYPFPFHFLPLKYSPSNFNSPL